MNLLIFGMDSTTYGSVVDGVMRYCRSLELAITEGIARKVESVTLVCERMPSFDIGEMPENMRIIVAPVNGDIGYDKMHEILNAHPERIKPYDLVFCTSISGCKAANHISRQLRIPCVVQVLDVPKWRLEAVYPRIGMPNWLEQWNAYFAELARCDMIIVNTEATVKEILEHFKGDELVKKKLRLIYYGIDTDAADKVAEPEKELYDVSFVSRITFYKGCDHLLYALAMLKAEGIEPKTAIIGSGDELAKLIQMKYMLGLDKVEFLGPISNDDKWKIIKGSNIGVIPEYCENIGSLAPAEYMVCKRRVITWSLSIHQERFGITPYRVETFNTKALAGEIKRLLAESPDMTRVNEGYNFVKEKRSYHGMVDDLLQNFQGLLSQDPKL